VELPAAIRRRFGHSDADSAGEAEGRPVNATQLRIRSVNFGQHWRTPGGREVSYSVLLPLAFVADLLQQELPEYVDDCIKFPDSTPLEAALRRSQWPSTAQILDDPELCALALSWFAHDCLLKWFGDGKPEGAENYVINTVDLSERQGDAVRFAGVARAAGQPVQYQDV
jgi:hypothetical protein